MREIMHIIDLNYQGSALYQYLEKMYLKKTAAIKAINDLSIFKTKLNTQNWAQIKQTCFCGVKLINCSVSVLINDKSYAYIYCKYDWAFSWI